MAQIRTPLQPADDLEPAPTHGDNRPLPVRSLRDWLDHLAARDRLVVVKPGIGLRFDLAAVAKRLDGLRATVFPRPGGHSIPVVSGLISDRGWMAEAMGSSRGRFLPVFKRPREIRFHGGRRPRRRRTRSSIGTWTSSGCFRSPLTTSTTGALTSRPD